MTIFNFLSPCYVLYFNSHPHEEDDSNNRERKRTWKHFNSHPHEEDDYFGGAVGLASKYFNSHPHEEDDTSCIRIWKGCPVISTHILTKRMTRMRIEDLSQEVFQLTSSRRGWHLMGNSFSVWLIFQLTSSRRGWPNEGKISINAVGISTHILTKRMTTEYVKLFL